jgi:hypothetical protein
MVSVLLHPVFIPAAMMAFLIYGYPEATIGVSPKNARLWLMMVTYISILFPTLTVFLLWRLKMVNSMQLHEQKERYGPLMASMLFYFWVYWVFHKEFNAPLPIQVWLLSVFLSTVWVFMATIFFKISLHTAAWGSAAAFLVYLTWYNTSALPFLLLVILLAGIIGSARFYLNEHSPKQLYAGYIVGIISTLMAIAVAALIP